MNPDDEHSDDSVFEQAEEVDKNLIQENPGLHIKVNENKAQLHPHYIHGLWTQLMKLAGINLIDATDPNQLPTKRM